MFTSCGKLYLLLFSSLSGPASIMCTSLSWNSTQNSPHTLWVIWLALQPHTVALQCFWGALVGFWERGSITVFLVSWCLLNNERNHTLQQLDEPQDPDCTFSSLASHSLLLIPRFQGHETVPFQINDLCKIVNILSSFLKEINTFIGQGCIKGLVHPSFPSSFSTRLHPWTPFTPSSPLSVCVFLSVGCMALLPLRINVGKL